MTKIGVFIPVGNRGWLVTTTSPTKAPPSFDLNRAVVQRAEFYGLDFALAMIKLRGYGGPSEFWDYNLEGFTLMAGIAAVTKRIQLFASVPVLVMPPALVARMAVTIDSIAPGRFGVNMVTGWQRAEYEQMGLWPGDEHYLRRYDYLTEHVQIMKDLWMTGVSNFSGKYFQMHDCRLGPRPSTAISIVVAGQSDRGMRFAAEHADYNFIFTGGLNEPEKIADQVGRLSANTAQSGRHVGALCLVMIIAAASDAEALAKWEHYKSGADLEALAWQLAQATGDKHASADSNAGALAAASKKDLNEFLYPGSKLIGSYGRVAEMLDQIAEIKGVDGIMLVCDDFIVGMEQFGEHIQPLMKSRRSVRT